jgi:hypothetical protein
MSLPAFCLLPDLVNGIPISLEILFFIPDIPEALFHEKDNPYFLATYKTPNYLNLVKIYKKSKRYLFINII